MLWIILIFAFLLVVWWLWPEWSLLIWIIIYILIESPDLFWFILIWGVVYLIYKSNDSSTENVTIEKDNPKDEIDNNIVNAENFDFVRKLSPHDFEKLVWKIFKFAWYRTQETKISWDKWVDLYIEKDWVKGIVQCKRYKDKIGTPIIRDFIGTMSIHRASLGYIFTTSTYTIDAIKTLQEENYNIVLIDTNGISELLNWMKEGSQISFEEALELAKNYINLEVKMNQQKRKIGYEKYKNKVK